MEKAEFVKLRAERIFYLHVPGLSLLKFFYFSMRADDNGRYLID
jgi:hypothetical protein